MSAWWKGSKRNIDRLLDFSLPLPEDTLISGGSGYGKSAPDYGHDQAACPMCPGSTPSAPTPEDNLLRAIADLPAEGTTFVLSVSGVDLAVDLSFTGPLEEGRAIVQLALDNL